MTDTSSTSAGEGTTAARAPRAGRNLPVAIAVGLGLLALVAVSLAFRPELFVLLATVAVGAALWELAQGVATPGEDLREVVSGLVELNGLSSSGVRAGQTILLPVAER